MAKNVSETIAVLVKGSCLVRPCVPSAEWGSTPTSLQRSTGKRSTEGRSGARQTEPDTLPFMMLPPGDSLLKQMDALVLHSVMGKHCESHVHDVCCPSCSVS
jgi:hypothetical protein